MALFGDSCARLLGWVVLLFFVSLLFAVFYRVHCQKEPDQKACGRVPYLLILALVMTLLALVLLLCCCNELGARDYDLAMVGIWWEGQLDGEAGAHLRWAFRYGLPFPEGGFDLYRRPSNSGSWTLINDAAIKPADVFPDGASTPGPMWQHRAVDRLHPSRLAHFEGEPFDDLVELVNRPPYATLGPPPHSTLYYVEEPDDPALPTPDSPYASEAEVRAYLDSYGGTQPLTQWSLEPMQLVMLLALDPEIARLLGLLYIDKTADPDTEYDYRIIGHWADVDRSYTLTNLSRARTESLDAPHLTLAQSPVEYQTLAGDTTREDRLVALRWDPPTANPELELTAEDGIKPVRFLPRVKPLGARPCSLPPPPSAEFVAVRRRTPAGDEEVAPLAVTPEEGEDGQLTWPTFFYLDRNVDYECYAYFVEGLDIFGRRSPSSNVLVADVQDFTGPPPPLNIAATVFQSADTATINELPAPRRDALFPAGSSHDKALHISWVWPDDFLTTVPDLKEFHVYYKVTGYETLSGDTWADPNLWVDTGVVISVGAGQPLPPRLTAAGVTNAKYYEAIVLAPPMTANDDAPVVYGYAGVGGVDHDPFNNPGPVSPPSVIVARDFDPPGPPPVPSLDKGPDPTDKGSNAVLSFSWDADARYAYHLMRLPGKRLAGVDTPTGALPLCLASDEPTCTGDAPPCVEERRQFTLRRKAQAHPELFGTTTMAPEGPQVVGGGHRFKVVDKVDATVGGDYLYAGRAIDPAGNMGPLGCPQLVLVRDYMPPRPPTVTEIVGREGGIRIRWSANPEDDLERYRIYRTGEPDNDGSTDRMALVFEANSDGTTISPAGAPAATRSGVGSAYVTLAWEDGTARPLQDYFYRLVALDRSGNTSTPSASARGRATDTTPPAAPAWTAPPTRNSDSQGDFILLTFAPPAGDSDARLRIQREEESSSVWRPVSEWLVSGVTEFTDRSAPNGIVVAYRIQAMDQAGNVGPFNEKQSPP
jgi:hypothetical protein